MLELRDRELAQLNELREQVRERERRLTWLNGIIGSTVSENLQQTNGHKQVNGAPFDLERISKEVVLELGPEFDAQTFRNHCISKFPDRVHDFTPLRTKRLLRGLFTAQEPTIELLEKGRGRRSPRFKVIRK